MSERRTDLLIGASLALLVALVFGQTLDHDFVGYDDPFYVTDQPVVQKGLTAEGFVWAFRHGADEAYWTPVTYLSHMLDVELFGMRPGLHHLSSVALHAINSVLVYAVLLYMTGRRWACSLVAAWFAVHPLHVESVAWVAERKDLLSGLFFLLCVWAYAAYVRRDGGWPRYALVLVLFALGLMSKPMLVTVPAVLLLLDYWPLKRPAHWPVLLVEKAPMAVMSLAVAVFAMVAQRDAGAMRTLEQFPVGFRIANAIVSYARYLAKTIWPFDLAVFYPPPVGGWPLYIVGLCAIALLALTALVVATRETRPWLIVGWLWFVGMLVPVIGVVQVGRQAMADRYTYLPHIGLFVMIAWSAAELARRSEPVRRVLIAAVTVATLVFAIRAADQARYWKNTSTLFEHAMAVTPPNAVTLNQMGNARLRANPQDIAGAEELYRAALQLEPGYGMAHLNLGNLLARRRQFAEAAEHFEAAIRWRPTLARAHMGLGVARTGLREYERADESFGEAERLAPHLEDVRRAWKNSRMERGIPTSVPATRPAALAPSISCPNPYPMKS